MTSKEHSEVELTKAILKMQSLVGRDRSLQVLDWLLTLQDARDVFQNERTLLFLLDNANFELHEELKDAVAAAFDRFPQFQLYLLLQGWALKISYETK